MNKIIVQILFLLTSFSLASQNIDEHDVYLKALKLHIIKFQNGSIPIDTVYVETNPYHRNYSGIMGDIYIDMVSKKKIEERTRGSSTMFLTKIHPIKVNDNGSLSIVVTNYDVSRKRRRYTYASSDPTFLILEYNCDTSEFDISYRDHL